MAAKWLWNNVNIYVSEQDADRDVKRAELNKLDATSSTFHYFGAASKRVRIKGIVIGTTDRDSIESDAINNVSRSLTTPWETLSNCLIDGTPKFSTKKYTGGVIDGVAYTVGTTPLYDAELEIIV